ncbi:MAG TPA: hypothetical protein QGI27_04075 [Flavobacteriaceae bacterium]|jgi:hypothetical protein|nr:hypothetical protein [Flavobacteriaceae bacterium]|tara:strand:- start:163 stop:348 length:186 start_codon:yes stop_codon:yes gene_type:complete
MKEIIIKDDYGKDFKIKNLDEFKRHLINFHSINGEGDNSLHTEEGKYFIISKEFYKSVMEL